MRTKELKLLGQNQLFNGIGALNTNANGYPYLTLLRTKAGAETASANFYFANAKKINKESGEVIREGLADRIKEIFKISGANQKCSVNPVDLVTFLLNEEKCVVAMTLNAKGEPRMKLASGGQSRYLTQSDMMSLFDLTPDEIVTDFDDAEFIAQFRTKGQVVNPDELHASTNGSTQDQLDALYDEWEKATTARQKTKLLTKIQVLDPKATTESVDALVTA